MAGGGALPLLLAHAAQSAGWIIQYQSFVARPDVSNLDIKPIDISKPLDIVLGIRRFKATHICMVGGVNVSDKGREGFFKYLGGRKRQTKPSGDTGLSKLGKALEIATGAKLMGVHEIMPELLAPVGHIAGPKLSKSTIVDGCFALETAASAGALDLGQAVVCSGNRVIAVEDIAGTDALMLRVKGFHEAGLVGDGKSVLILAKAKKPRQPMFADLPAIGPDTILAAEAAGISAVFVEADKSIIIERDKLDTLAEQHCVSVFGATVDGR